MKIVFDVPHVFNPKSSPQEDAEVKRILNDALQRIVLAYRQCHSDSSPPIQARVTGGKVFWDLPHVFHPQAKPTEEAIVLRTLLDTLISINFAYLARRPNTPTLYQTRVFYGRTQIWDSIPALYERGYGDCKSLSAARIAELIKKRRPAQPTFRFVERPNGYKDFHILVQRYEGWEDPSRKLGMGANELAHFRL